MPMRSSTRGATHVVFDKTGTLTEPGIALDRIDEAASSDGDDALALAAALAPAAGIRSHARSLPRRPPRCRRSMRARASWATA